MSSLGLLTLTVSQEIWPRLKPFKKEVFKDVVEFDVAVSLNVYHEIGPLKC